MTNPKLHRRLAAIAAAVLLLAITPSMAQQASFQTLEGGIKARTLAPGQGPVAQEGQVATIHFIGWFDEGGARGREIYNTRREDHPVSFLIGTDKVMPAWNAGVEGMQVGERRMLLVPPGMAWGSQGVPGEIPPDTSLMLQIELVALEGND